MHTVKLNVHPADCSCERAPDCRGKCVVNMPDTNLPPRVFTDVDEALALAREYAVGGPPVGQPGVRGPVREPSEDRLRGR
jgi:hypothetical protein